ncbi:MAG: antibiotic biosynthesis monooxygenase [Deltaproteobacteria bacterium]|nr:antibiotic biosynthesis monooxygenase [Deltaproteobacteria bacterium]MBV8452234.1 antibiotic biosynthesis monooxygenase [Deltaproteobacteria bacterium]
MDQNNAAALITRIQVRPGIEEAFAAWHARMSTAPGNSPGFISAEIKAPAAQGDMQWSVVQHFRSAKEMRAWQCSQAHERLLTEIGAIAGNNDVREMESAQADSESTVTEVIATMVKPGSESAYREWAARIHAAEAQFPGYRGGFLQPPISDKQPYWTTLVRFASPEELDGWLNSSERKKLLGEHEGLVQSWDMHRLPSSFAGWFPEERNDREAATTLKQSMVVLLVLFPIVMGELRFLTPVLRGLPSAPATFVGNAISVGLIGWPFMPIAIAFLNWWLSPEKGSGWWLQSAGYALLVGLYVAEIAALWNLL